MNVLQILKICTILQEHKTVPIDTKNFEELHKINVTMKPIELMEKVIKDNHYVYTFLSLCPLHNYTVFILYNKVMIKKNRNLVYNYSHFGLYKNQKVLMKCKSSEPVVNEEIELPMLSSQDELPPRLFS